ncbi:amidohydrolase family protein [Epilithonimonas sp.]|uniref:amidohydrolase family protein n=1 Tax=Epilithonimonas sp. TaxID=2894511 RepID=UPI00289BCA40|nr:amidohydrolase family protein [Epilithonimonas sp.]
MKKLINLSALCLTLLAFFGCGSEKKAGENSTLFKNATVLSGNGDDAKISDILVEDGKIIKIGENLSDKANDTVDLTGKFLMPALISAHVHIGLLQGTTNSGDHYTEQNIMNQLKKYQDYGVLNVLAMGSDRSLIFESGLRDKSVAGTLEGARFYSAGYGFGVPNGAPPKEVGMDYVYRPTSPDQIAAEMDSLVKVKPTVVKLWVDDFNGKYPKKMGPAIYKKIIDEAHKRNLRVAAHVYYLSDLQHLVKDGADIIGHSVRDKVIDDATLQEMKVKHVIYIPTLSLDEFAYIYAKKPEWLNNEFFKKSLEPGVYEKITSEAYQNELKKSPLFAVNTEAFNTALQNLKRVFDAGIPVAFGTDSGAMFLRAQGFSEHLELQLIVEAGLTPSQAITIATKNAAKAIGIDKDFGTIENGKTADFLILNANPLNDIKNTENINSVYKAGKEVSKGPLAK